ncbi:MAG TPA: hypothetical protein VLE96_02185 [Chlamydiales bacterium]|nr:hypothetical protein [Chlamydiales bacterium]
MSKDLLKYVLIGLAASFCISAKDAGESEEIAMMRCSKERGYCDQDEGDRPFYPEHGRSSHSDRDRSYYPDHGRRFANEHRGYDDRARRDYRDDRRMDDRRGHYHDNRHEHRCPEQRCAPRCERCAPRCGQERCCSPDAYGNAGHTLDSAGRRRCTPRADREYKIYEQTNCDSKGRCQEHSKLEKTSRPVEKREVAVKRKSAAQKVLEGY